MPGDSLDFIVIESNTVLGSGVSIFNNMFVLKCCYKVLTVIVKILVVPGNFHLIKYVFGFGQHRFRDDARANQHIKRIPLRLPIQVQYTRIRKHRLFLVVRPINILGSMPPKLRYNSAHASTMNFASEACRWNRDGFKIRAVLRLFFGA